MIRLMQLNKTTRSDKKTSGRPVPHFLKSAGFLFINILAVVYIKKYNNVGGVEIKKHPIVAGDAKRKNMIQGLILFDVQPWIAPVGQEVFLLRMINVPDVFG